MTYRRHSAIPRVRLIPWDETSQMCVMQCADSGEILNVAMGGGPTKEDAKRMAYEFIDALKSAVDRL